MRKYTDIVLERDKVVAMAGKQRYVFDRGNYTLYIAEYGGKGEVHYRGLTYKDQHIFAALESFIKGKWHKEEDIFLLNRVYIKYGFLDKTLTQFEMIPVEKLVVKFVKKELHGSEQSKMYEILKNLNLPSHKARESHKDLGDGNGAYDPAKRLADIVARDYDVKQFQRKFQDLVEMPRHPH